MQIESQELVRKTEIATRDVIREAAARWFSASQRHLADAAAGTNLHFILQSATPPEWDAEREAYIFDYRHVAAPFHEFGARPHEIRARHAEYLAFEWPDAPPKIREQFKETFPLVFFKRVFHPGVPTIGFVRHGRDVAADFLRSRGVHSRPMDEYGEGRYLDTRRERIASRGGGAP